MARGSAATSEAEYARLQDKEPSAIHKRDAELINELVGKNVVTAKQVMYCKILLMKTQAIRAMEKAAGGGKKASAKATTAKASTAKPATRRAAGKAAPAKGTKTTTAKGRAKAVKGGQAAASQESATAPAEDPTSDAPF